MLRDDIPPQDLCAEAQVLHDVMTYGKGHEIAFAMLREDDFFHVVYRECWKAIQKLREEGIRHTQARVGAILAELTNISMTKAKLSVSLIEDAGGWCAMTEHYCKSIIDCSVRRKAIELGKVEIAKLYDRDVPSSDVIFNSVKLREELQKQASSYKPEETTIDIINAWMDRKEEMQKRGGGLVGISTTLSQWDDLTLGMREGEYWIAVAPSGSGKSSLLTQMLDFASSEGHSCLFASYEMNRDSIYDRIAAQRTGINCHKIGSGCLSEAEWAAVGKVASELARRHTLRIDRPKGNDVDELISYAKSIKDLRILGVDYIQKLTGKGDGRVGELEYVTERLQQFAQDANITVLSLAQLNDEGLVYGCRKIFKDADVYMRIVPNGDPISGSPTIDCGFKLEKNRNGPAGAFIGRFHKEQVMFRSGDDRY